MHFKIPLLFLSFLTLLGVKSSTIQHQFQSSQPKSMLKWFSHGPLLICANSDNYYFDNNNPNHDNVYPEYKGNSMITANFAVNEADYQVLAYDSTEERYNLTPQYSLTPSPEIYSDGIAYVGFSTFSHLPENCKISNDTPHLNDAYYAYHLSNAENPRIGTGLVLYRSSLTGIFSGWDHAIALSQFITNPELRLSFEPSRCVQIALLYEVDNYDNSLIKHHHYYNMVGLYSFRTSSKRN